jgi:hypothetical protein
MMEIWGTNVPLKVQIFLWMAWHDRIQTTHQLKRRNWDKDDVCKFCDVEETVNHLLFQCPIARETWCWIRDRLGWPSAPYLPLLTFRISFFYMGMGVINILCQQLWARRFGNLEMT